MNNGLRSLSDEDPLDRNTLLLLGGTFDPAHIAHREMLRLAEQEHPDAGIIVEPTDQPPHKSTTSVAFNHRAEMAIRLLADQPAALSFLQHYQDGAGYTVTSLQRLRQAYDGTIRLVMGGDSAASFYDWHQPEMILLRATPLIIPRPGFGRDEIIGSIARDRNRSAAEQWGEFIIETDRQHNISSTELREHFPTTNRPDGIPERVWSYITHHGLYGCGDDTNDK